jgi:hypothetical protein
MMSTRGYNQVLYAIDTGNIHLFKHLVSSKHKKIRLHLSDILDKCIRSSDAEALFMMEYIYNTFRLSQEQTNQVFLELFKCICISKEGGYVYDNAFRILMNLFQSIPDKRKMLINLTETCSSPVVSRFCGITRYEFFGTKYARGICESIRLIITHAPQCLYKWFNDALILHKLCWVDDLDLLLEIEQKLHIKFSYMDLARNNAFTTQCTLENCKLRRYLLERDKKRTYDLNGGGDPLYQFFCWLINRKNLYDIKFIFQRIKNPEKANERFVYGLLHKPSKKYHNVEIFEQILSTFKPALPTIFFTEADPDLFRFFWEYHQQPSTPKIVSNREILQHMVTDGFKRDVCKVTDIVAPLAEADQDILDITYMHLFLCLRYVPYTYMKTFLKTYPQIDISDFRSMDKELNNKLDHLQRQKYRGFRLHIRRVYQIPDDVIKHIMAYLHSFEYFVVGEN